MNKLKKVIGLIGLISMTLLVVSCGPTEKSQQSTASTSEVAVTGTEKSDPVKKRVKVEAPEDAVETVTVTDIAKHPAQKEIAKLIEAGAMTIGGDGKFKPNQVITRGEFLEWIYKFDNRGISPHEPQKPSFPDLSKDSPYYGIIEGMRAAGVIVGFPDGTIKADKELTREELALLWGWYVQNRTVTDPVNHMGLGLLQKTDHKQVGTLYIPAVETYDELMGKVFGESVKIMPQQVVTRGEAAKWIITGYKAENPQK